MKEGGNNEISMMSQNSIQNTFLKSKQFQFQGTRITYQNKLQITENKRSKIVGFNVVNNLFQFQNNKFTKIILVQFQNKVIKIEDQFYFQNTFNIVKKGLENAQIKKRSKPQIFKKSDQKRSFCLSMSKNQKSLKNIVKNIVKIFINWLQKKDQMQDCTKSMQELLNFNNSKYNNSLILKISQNLEINAMFLKFIETQGIQLIQTSRIKDKKKHIERLKYYQHIFQSSKQKAVLSKSMNQSYQATISENSLGNEDFKISQSSQDSFKESMQKDKFFTMASEQFCEDKFSCQGLNCLLNSNLDVQIK